MVGSKSKPSIRLAVCLIQAIVVGSKNTTLREKNLRGAPRAAQRINKRHVSTAGKQAKVPAATRAHPYHTPPTLAFYRDSKNTQQLGGETEENMNRHPITEWHINIYAYSTTFEAMAKH